MCTFYNAPGNAVINGNKTGSNVGKWGISTGSSCIITGRSGMRSGSNTGTSCTMTGMLQIHWTNDKTHTYKQNM